MSEDLRNALSTFLYRSGESSNKFMLMFATNEPAVRRLSIVAQINVNKPIGN